MCFHRGVFSAKSKNCWAKPDRGGALISGSAFADRNGIREGRSFHAGHGASVARLCNKADA